MAHRSCSLLLGLVVSLVACGPVEVSPLSVDGGDFGDVGLPDIPLPDGSSFSLAVAEAAASVADPSAVCGFDGATGDASVNAADAGEGRDDAPCAGTLGPGDLVFDEVMIATEPGSADKGQWLEVRSTRSCSVDLIGLHAQAPKGTSFHTLDVTSDVWIPPGGFFLIADSVDPTDNHDLPGLVLGWAGSSSDVIHKTSDTVTLSVGSVVIDTLTYKAHAGLEAVSMAFPSTCAPDLRADFSSWQESVASWTPGFYGTPGAANSDVRCAVAPPPLCAAMDHRRR